MRNQLLLLLTAVSLFPLNTLAEGPIACPDVSQVSQGVFYDVHKVGNDFTIGGYFDVDQNIYNRWALVTSDVKSVSSEAALNDANAALKNPNVVRVTEQSSYWGGTRGGVCSCVYQIQIPYENTVNSYRLLADKLC